MISATYLQRSILYWRTPRQTARLAVVDPIIHKFCDEMSEHLVKHYASLSFRASWGVPAFVSHRSLLD